MSRRDREYVWFQWYHMKEKEICHVCNKNMMYRDDNITWHREHILKLSLGGKDIYPNLIPICPDCNLGMGKRCRSTYQHMHNIGLISYEQMLKLERDQDILCNNFDPICTKIQVNGSRCANLKGGKEEIYCWFHIRNELEPMDCSD